VTGWVALPDGLELQLSIVKRHSPQKNIKIGVARRRSAERDVADVLKALPCTEGPLPSNFILTLWRISV
jgi:hypothetical protein